VPVLAWLFWLLVIIVAAVLLLWAFVIGVVVLGGAASTDLCPRCGLSLGITERDRVLEHQIDPRYRSRAWDRCLKCGWRRGEDP